MCRVLLASAVAILCVLNFALPAGAQELPVPTAILDRIGQLPGELVAAKKTDGEVVDALYVAALLRLPTDKEKETVVKHLSTARIREDAARDIAWALVNTKEFLKLHGLDKNTTEALKAINDITRRWGKKEEKN